MPAMRYFVVKQTREIRVWANEPGDAVVLGLAALDDEKWPEGIAGSQIAPFRTTHVEAIEETP